MARKIGLISDTHGFLPDEVCHFLLDRDEIWHAGDIGKEEVIRQLEQIAPVKAVYGNIDNAEMRLLFPKFLLFHCEQVKVLMTHIGGYPNRYERNTLQKIQQYRPQLFISGHSHILKIIYDNKYQLLHMNPGAAGNNGFHRYITAIRFDIDGSEILNAEVFERDRR